MLRKNCAQLACWTTSGPRHSLGLNDKRPSVIFSKMSDIDQRLQTSEEQAGPMHRLRRQAEYDQCRVLQGDAREVMRRS